MLILPNMPSQPAIPVALGHRKPVPVASLPEPLASQTSHKGWPNLSSCELPHDGRLSLIQEIQVLARIVVDICIAHAPWKDSSITPESLMLLYPSSQEQVITVN